jgi:hypothetical protein
MELLVLIAFCALVGLGCLGGAAFAVLGGEDVGVGRIFLVIVWTMFAALFLGMAGWIARQIPVRKEEKKASNKVESTATAAPAGKSGS